MRRIHWLRVLLLSTGGLLAVALLLYFVLLADLPNPAHVTGTIDAPSILITDRYGQLLYEVIDPDGNKHVPLALAEIPLACRQATIATEDGHFYSHPGIDPTAIIRAAWQNWREGYTVSGASTLTQQLARNLYMTEQERVEQSLRRKLREAWLAWRLEQIYSKDELLALYLNTTYYGHFAVGIEAAAQAYFGMHASELDLAQCALLAGLPQYPYGYNPTENPEAARYRQHVVLGLMVKDGYITQTQATDAGREGMAYAGAPFSIEAPHFVMWVQGQLEEMLGPERLRAGGLRVTTTLDLDWQRQAEAIVRRRLAALQPCAAGAAPLTCDPLADPARRVDNAALVALDPETGAVLALVGSPDYFDRAISGAVNAALSPRQPGSAIKPLTYAAALDPARAAKAGQEPWTPATVIADLRTVFPTQEGRPYAPQNYDLHYHGPVSVRAALANSYNIPAVKTLQFIGVDALVEVAARLGIPWDQGIGYWVLDIGEREMTVNHENAQYLIPDIQLPTSQFGLALTLGGGEVRLLDLTAAYAAFANGGHRVDPFAISRVEALTGEILFDAQGDVGAEGSSNASVSSRTSNGDETNYAARNAQYAARNPQALDPRVAYLITDILSDETARLPALGAGNVLEIGRPAAAKTGTTTDWRDNWTVGYTPELATGVGSATRTTPPCGTSAGSAARGRSGTTSWSACCVTRRRARLSGRMGWCVSRCARTPGYFPRIADCGLRIADWPRDRQRRRPYNPKSSIQNRKSSPVPPAVSSGSSPEPSRSRRIDRTYRSPPMPVQAARPTPRPRPNTSGRASTGFCPTSIRPGPARTTSRSLHPLPSMHRRFNRLHSTRRRQPRAYSSPARTPTRPTGWILGCR